MRPNKSSISDSLFSKVRQRLLAIFYNHPINDFYTNEIISLSKSGRGAVQRELAALSAIGIIVVKQVGNQKRYQANKLAPIFHELRGIVIKTFGLADHLREALLPLKSSIDIAFIYGSVAKQVDTARSDIDIMLLGTKISYAKIYQVLENVEQQLGRKINPTCYTLSDWQSKLRRNNHFIKKISQQEKIFIIGSENELGKSG